MTVCLFGNTSFIGVCFNILLKCLLWFWVLCLYAFELITLILILLLFWVDYFGGVVLKFEFTDLLLRIVFTLVLLLLTLWVFVLG